MWRTTLRCLAVALPLLPASAQAVGESAVITLMFPAGAENCALGESGVSHARNIYTAFWNPACLPAVFDQDMTNVTYGSFGEELLPSLQIDLYHRYSSLCLFLNDVLPYTDLSYAFFRNHLDMGENEIFDSLGLVDRVRSEETVTANCIAFRAFDILSVGLSYKEYDSRLAPGIGLPLYPDDGTATGRTFDIGIRAGKRFDILGMIELEPAAGVSLLNLGNDSAQYIAASGDKDPLPRMAVYGGSVSCNLLELFEYTVIYEEDYSFVSERTEIQEHFGQRIQLSPFYVMLRGHMYDSAGHRNEYQKGYTWVFNLQKTLRAVRRVAALYDRIGHRHVAEKLARVDAALSVGRLRFLPNVHVSRSHSTIDARGSNQVRDGQTRDDWSVGIGVIGSVSSWGSRSRTVPRPAGATAPAPDTTAHTASGRRLPGGAVILEEEDVAPGK